MSFFTRRVWFAATVAVILTAAATFPANARGAVRPRCASEPAFTVTNGCETASVVVGSGTFPGVKASGKIEPPLPNGTLAQITDVKMTGCGTPATQAVSPSCYSGGGNQGVWNIQMKDEGCNNKSCTGIEVTFTVNGNDYIVTLNNPHKTGKVTIDFATPYLARTVETLAVCARDPNGNLMNRYNGFVTVRAGSLRGSIVKLNGRYGVGLVRLVDGVGSFTVDATNAIPGDTIYFDLEADLLDTNRAGIDIE